MFFRKPFASTTLALLLSAASGTLAPHAYGASYPLPFVRSDGVNTVVYNAGYTWPFPNNIVALSITGTGIGWRFMDLSTLTGAPHAAGGFAAVLRSDGVTSVVYQGLFDKSIHAINFAPSGGWWTENISAQAHAPDAAGDPAAYRRSDNFDSVVYRTSNNHIAELYFKPGLGWHFGDLSALTGSPDAAGDPVAYVRSDKVNSVLYRDFNGDIQELYLTLWGSSWCVGDISAMAHAPRAGGNPAAYIRNDGVNSVVYRGYADDHDVHELYLDRGLNWQWEDLSFRTGAPAALGDPAGYVRSDGVNSVVYRALEHSGQVHIQELSSALPPGPPPRFPASPVTLNWQTADLSFLTGGPNAAGDPAPYILNNPNSLINANAVVYRDTFGNIQELYLHPGVYWLNYNLTQQSGAPPSNQ